MNFTFVRHNYQPPPPSLPKNINPVSLLRRPNMYGAGQPQRAIQPEPPKPVVSPPEKKTMTWGEPTWFFFHTLAEKVKPDKFPKIKRDLVNIVRMICNNLPCPICAEHATAFMNKVNFNAINTRDNLKMLFFRFHNEVNMRKGYSLFTEDELNEKYPTAITNNIFGNFVQAFEKKNGSMKLMADNLHRGRVMVVIKQWLVENRQYFLD